MDAWLVLLGAIIAGAVSIGGEILRGRQDSNLDGSRRTNDRKIERDRIQRDTLIELQVALIEWLRVQALTSMSDIRAIRTTGTYGVHGDDLAAGQLATARHLAYLTQRVKDDVLRESLERLRAMTPPALPRSEAEARAAMDALTFASGPVQDQLGEVLRTYL